MSIESEQSNGLFADDGSEVALPPSDGGHSSSEAAVGSRYETLDIHNDLMKSRVTGMAVKECDGYESNSYLIDLTECNNGITLETSNALKAILVEDAEQIGSSLAVYVQTRTNVFLVGRCGSFRAYTLLDRILEPLFGKNVKLYFNGGDGFKEVRNIKLGAVRLGL